MADGLPSSESPDDLMARLAAGGEGVHAAVKGLFNLYNKRALLLARRLLEGHAQSSTAAEHLVQEFWMALPRRAGKYRPMPGIDGPWPWLRVVFANDVKAALEKAATRQEDREVSFDSSNDAHDEGRDSSDIKAAPVHQPAVDPAPLPPEELSLAQDRQQARERLREFRRRGPRQREQAFLLLAAYLAELSTRQLAALRHVRCRRRCRKPHCGPALCPDADEGNTQKALSRARIEAREWLEGKDEDPGFGIGEAR